MACWSRCLVSLLAAALIVVGGASRGEYVYRLTPLGTLDGGSLSRAYGLNNAGQVTGEADTRIGNLDGFFWAGGNAPLIDIGTLDGGNASRGSAINDSGQVAGQGRVRSGFSIFTHAFRTGADGRNPVDLGVLDASHQYSVANAIANGGMVAGTSVNAAGLTRAVLWASGGQISDLGALYEQGQSEGLGINASGVVVGRSDVRIGSTILSHATRFTADPHTGQVLREDLGALVALGTSVATAISDSGLVTGSSTTSSGFSHAFLFRDGAPMEDIHSPAFAGSSLGLAINSAGVVVGELKLNGLGSRAFVWTSALGMINLNDLIDPALGWTLSAATGINNQGQIVGYGTIQGRTRGFLLTPTGPIVPEPSSLILLGLGGLLMFVCSVPAAGRVSWERIWSVRRRHNPRAAGE